MHFKPWYLYAALGVLALTLLIALTAQMRRASAAETRLHEAALSALTETAEALSQLTLSTEKLLISGTPRQAVTHLDEMAAQAGRARIGFSSLPADMEQISPLMAWLGGLQGQIRSLQGTVQAGGMPDAAAEEALRSAHAEMSLLGSELTLARDALIAGTPVPEALGQTQLTAAPTVQELISWRGLPSGEVSGGEALAIARDFVGRDRVTAVSHAPDLTGALPCFGVQVDTIDLSIYAEVTQKGGKVLMMSPETAAFTPLRSEDECVRAAVLFLNDRGFAAMTPVYREVYDGLCVITLVHEQEGVLVWSDRVVAQVRMDTAEVVGLEARGYWQHHTPRRITQPLVTKAEARTSLSPDVTETDARLCLIDAGAGERLAWQFSVQAMDGTYLVFIDATTGRELLLEKLIDTDAGVTAA